jgi:crossover junction endodeoxyribonuclease RuvC
MKYRMGIDPGLEGAIACIDENDSVAFLFDMPVMAMGKNKKQVNAAELGKQLIHWQRYIGTDNLVAYMEYISARPGQGVSSMFNFGKSCGIVQGILGALQIPVVFVTPVTWKKRANLSGKPKDMARTLAQQLYPGADLARKKDIGRADALLIARHGLK